MGRPAPADFGSHAAEMILTPREIDERIARAARLLGYGIDLALHDLSPADVTALVG